MDEISQDPKRDFRLPHRARRWLAIAGAVGLVAATTVIGVTRLGGHPAGSAARAPTATASRGSQAVIVATSAPSPATTQLIFTAPPGSPVISPPAVPAAPQAAPGTVLLTCDSVVWGQPDPNWQAGSLRVGTMWLLDGRRLGYVRLGRTQQAAGGAAGHGTASRDVQMLVHVDAGSAVVMRAAAGASHYFEFLNSPGPAAAFQGLDGGRGFTFTPCSAPDLGYGGRVAFYDVGFSIIPGHTASAEVWTAPSARPVWLTFTAPAGLG